MHFALLRAALGVCVCIGLESVWGLVRPGHRLGTRTVGLQLPVAYTVQYGTTST